MFGYLQPYKPLLLVKDFELYKSVYCSLCRCLGKNYGFTARLTLSYDCTFYAMIIMGLDGACPDLEKGRCVVNPLKKCNYCKGEQTALELAAALSVISVYYKLEDDIKDSGFFKRNFCRFLKLFASRWRRRAIKKYKAVDTIVMNMSDSQFKVEQSENPSSDRCAEPTAIMLRQVMELLANDESSLLIFGEFGYFLGKWIYLMDAADDYDKDLKKGNFNPFVNNKNISGMSLDDRKLYINGILNETVSRIIPAFNLMDIKIHKDILQNVVELGLGAMQKKIIFDKAENK